MSPHEPGAEPGGAARRSSGVEASSDFLALFGFDV